MIELIAYVKSLDTKTVESMLKITNMELKKEQSSKFFIRDGFVELYSNGPQK